MAANRQHAVAIRAARKLVNKGDKEQGWPRGNKLLAHLREDLQKRQHRSLAVRHRFLVLPPQSGGVTIIVAAIKSIMASLAAQCTFAGTGGLWFLAGILVGTSLGVLFAAIVRMGSDRG